MRFYEKLPDMECLSGDTLPAFHIQVEGAELSNCSMELILANSHSTNIAALTKECTPEQGGFTVQLTSDDTAQLTVEDTYKIFFQLIDNEGHKFKKLCGNIYVHSAP